MEYQLQDEKKRVLAYVMSKEKFTLKEITEILLSPVLQPRYKIVILYPDESEYMEIDENDIVDGSISYTNKYQKGERKTLSFTLINYNGKYTPSSNIKRERYTSGNKENTKSTLYTDEVWGDLKFAFYFGFYHMGKECWFKKGVYCIDSLSGIENDADRTIQFSLSDKFSILSGKQGTLLDTYEIPVGSDAIKVINDLFNMPLGNGYIYDYQPIIYDKRFSNFKTQATIRKDSGDTVASIIDDLATQMSANYYYNDYGCFTLEFLDETITDDNKIVCWEYLNKNYDLYNISYNYNFSEAVNVVKVVGDNINNGVYFATAINDDPRSPICVGRIGNRKEPPITNCNVWNDNMARELAIYNLRKKSLIPLELTATVAFNPLLEVDYLCRVEFPNLGFSNDRCVINSISLSTQDNSMNLSLTKTEDLDFLNAGGEYNGL